MKITVVLLTWKRITHLRKTLGMLASQTNKSFEVRISNGNLAMSNIVNQYVAMFKNKLSIKLTHDGNDTGTFRRFTVAAEAAKSGSDVILFIDDDVTFSETYIDQMISCYEPETYKSGFAWNFQQDGKDYYRYRTKVRSESSLVHYCGTGVAMVDASIFLNSGFFAAPKESFFIEDLWLSYFAQHVMKWKLKYIPLKEVHVGGGDQHALYKKIMKEKRTRGSIDKADFLRMLVQKYGWKL